MFFSCFPSCSYILVLFIPTQKTIKWCYSTGICADQTKRTFLWSSNNIYVLISVYYTSWFSFQILDCISVHNTWCFYFIRHMLHMLGSLNVILSAPNVRAFVIFLVKDMQMQISNAALLFSICENAFWKAILCFRIQGIINVATNIFTYSELNVLL